MNLIQRINKICREHGIDHNDLILCKDLEECIGTDTKPTLIGTVIHFKRANSKWILAQYLNGWSVVYVYDSEKDASRIFYNLYYNYNIKRSTIASILNISNSELNMIWTQADHPKEKSSMEEEDDVNE